MKNQKDILHLKKLSITIIFPTIRGPFKAIFLWLQVMARNTEFSRLLDLSFLVAEEGLQRDFMSSEYCWGIYIYAPYWQENLGTLKRYHCKCMQQNGLSVLYVENYPTHLFWFMKMPYFFSYNKIHKTYLTFTKYL